MASDPSSSSSSAEAAPHEGPAVPSVINDEPPAQYNEPDGGFFDDATDEEIERDKQMLYTIGLVIQQRLRERRESETTEEADGVIVEREMSEEPVTLGSAADRPVSPTPSDQFEDAQEE